MRKLGKGLRRPAVLAAALLSAALVSACGGKTAAPATEAAKETVKTEAAETAAAGNEKAAETAAAETEKAAETAKEAAAEPADGKAGDAGKAGKAAENGADPAAIYAEIQKQVELPEMYEADDDFLSNYYGIDTGVLDSYVFASADDAALADSVVILKVKEGEDVSVLSDALSMVRDQKAAEMQNYIPAQYEIVAKSEVQVRGNVVYLVISGDAEKIEGIIEDQLKK